MAVNLFINCQLLNLKQVPKHEIWDKNWTHFPEYHKPFSKPFFKFNAVIINLSITNETNETCMS